MSQTSYFNNTTASRLGIGLFKYEIAPRTRFIFTNIAMARLFGLSSQKDLSAKHLDDLFLSSLDKEEFLETLKKEGKIELFETACRKKRGRSQWLAISAAMTSNGNGEKYIEGIIQDVSSHKDTTEKLSHELESLQGFLDSMPDAIYFKDRKNRITKVNKFYAQGFGLKAEQIIGKTDFDFFPEDQAALMFKDDNSILKSGKPIIGKIERSLLPNGTWNQVITTKIPIFDRNSKIIGTMGITRDMTAHANLEQERFLMVLNALEVLGKALEMRDPYTYYHGRYVARIAHAIGQALKFDENHLIHLKLAAELHDLGKISVPLDLLIKPGKLSDLEFRLVRQHVENCHALIKDIAFPFPLAEIIYQHHERIDGSGYPRSLKGDEILIEARILAVSDVLEAMTSHRPYRAALGLHIAIKELEDGSGKRFDPKVVSTVLKIIRQKGGKPFWVN